MHHVTRSGGSSLQVWPLVEAVGSVGWQGQRWVAVPRVGLDSDIIGAGGGPGAHY